MTLAPHLAASTTADAAELACVNNHAREESTRDLWWEHLTVADSALSATLSVAPTSGEVGVAIVTINAATIADLPSLFAKALT
jgi:hypothetical protein